MRASLCAVFIGVCLSGFSQNLPIRKDSIPVHVFFGTKMVLSAAEMEAYARGEFKKRGTDVPSDAHCSINVALKTTNSVCYVRFSKDRRSFQLDLNADGRVLHARTNLIRALDPDSLTPEEKSKMIRQVESNSVKVEMPNEAKDAKKK